jgi:hypothetical protein
MILQTCQFCGGRLSRWGWYECPEEEVLYTVCIPCLCDDTIGFAAIRVIPKSMEDMEK